MKATVRCKRGGRRFVTSALLFPSFPKGILAASEVVLHYYYYYYYYYYNNNYDDVVYSFPPYLVQSSPVLVQKAKHFCGSLCERAETKGKERETTDD